MDVSYCRHQPPIVYVIEKNEYDLPTIISCRICRWKAHFQIRVSWYCPTCKGRHTSFSYGNSRKMYCCPDATPDRLYSQRIFHQDEMRDPQVEIVEVTVEKEPRTT